ncbi:hypothetical protein [Reinekea sp.]|jgi:hypothetical protein|uniref:hypothetical protein n=1 Tax=Reinekea sp. TaxID=1970455 RepID=UPI002A810097|nr:hypothetical protein [Reinekea sp.]
MSKQDDFFVGYLPTPIAIAGFYRIAIPLIALISLTLGAWIAMGQQSAGQGIWDISEEVEITGYLTVDPYPVIHFVGDDQRSVILVQQGKLSAFDKAFPFANSWVSISGYAITRGDWSMLEIPPSSAFVSEPANPSQDVGLEILGEITLQGEIIDSKCFLGVMKPGHGKTHRACAAMCLLGGMPPMFVVKSETGERFGYLLTAQDGTSASLELVDNVAVPVNLTGQLEKRGDMLYIRYDKSQLIRLSETALVDYGELITADLGLTHDNESMMSVDTHSENAHQH